MIAAWLLGCFAATEAPVVPPVAPAPPPAPVVVPRRAHRDEPPAAGAGVAARDGGPGFTGVGWQTRREAHALGDPLAPQGGVLRRAVASDDAIAAITELLAFESLLEPDGATGELGPRLATHWQVSKDGKTWKFRIDPRARWSDGAPVTASDVAAAASRAERPEVVTAISPAIVQVRAKAVSHRAFLSFATAPVVSPGWLGSGPYRAEGDGFARRTDWWAEADPVWDGLYNFARVELVRVPADGTALDLLRSGAVDLASMERPQQWASELAQDPDVARGLLVLRRFYTDAPRPVHGLLFDQARAPLDDPRIRRALGLLLDRDRAIAQSFHGEFEPVGHYVAPAAAPPPIYDELAAVHLLEASGWTTTDAAGIRTRDGERLALTVTYAQPGSERWLSFYRESAEHAGIALDLALVQPPTLGRVPPRVEADLTEVAVAPEPGAPQWRDPAVEPLIRSYDATLDPARRAALLVEIEAALQAAQPVALGWRDPAERVAFWNRFGMPPWGTARAADAAALPLAWWADPEREAALEAARADPERALDAGPDAMSFWRRASSGQ